MKTYCNPLDLNYHYSHHKTENVHISVRESADPTLVFFKGKYYLFGSMAAGFWYSEDLLHWNFHSDPELLIYDYAPDARQIGEYLYFCASRWGKNCPFLRTKDPLTEPFEEVSAPFAFWDPDLFCDEDGRVYFYWGCSNSAPIYGVEMNPETMMPIGEKKELIRGQEDLHGFERPGENCSEGKADSAIYQELKKLVDPQTGELCITPEAEQRLGHPEKTLRWMYDSIGRPWIEGAFMTKHNGRYYLQYAGAGTEWNTYFDGVYVADHPLGPFTFQTSNPFSSNPGGFITGAGHGSTVEDRYGNFWHTASMRISVGQIWERRLGLFPAGFDRDGELYCNQNFADYPHRIPQERFCAAEQQPEWMLLSYRKPVWASSCAEGSAPELTVNEDIRTWWNAGSAKAGEWICVDLQKECDIRAIQINLADENLVLDFPEERYGNDAHTRYIEANPMISSYRVEISRDAQTWETIECVNRDCVNAYYEYLDGITARYVRLTGGTLPYGQTLRVSGLRVFGNGDGEKPEQATAKAERLSAFNAKITWEPIAGAQGCNIRYGTAPDKLYQSWLVYGATEAELVTLIRGQDYYICVDSFNENGITPGTVFHLA